MALGASILKKIIRRGESASYAGGISAPAGKTQAEIIAARAQAIVTLLMESNATHMGQLPPEVMASLFKDVPEDIKSAILRRVIKEHNRYLAEQERE